MDYRVMLTAVTDSKRGSAEATDRGQVDRLLTVDALRAIAALSVLLHHMPEMYGPLAILRPLQAIGHTGVGLFLVLSGFSIHYRWAATRHRDGASFEAAVFWKRRFRRLYPTYVAAALLTFAITALLFDVAQPKWAFGGDTPWAVAFTSQVLLVPANFIPVAVLGIAWTLGLEIQLYAAYVLIVKRLKPFDPIKIVLAALIVAVAWRVGSQLVTPSVSVGTFFSDGSSSAESRFMYAQVPARAFEWFLGLLAAEALTRGVKLPSVSRSLFAGLALLVLAAVLFRHPIGEASLNGNRFFLSEVILDPLFGLSYFVILCSAVSRENTLHRRLGPALRVAAYIGVFSYSIYLIHQIALRVGTWAGLPTTGTAGWFSLPLLAILAVTASWAFHLAVERRFLKPTAPAKAKP